jgi:hypothetical protein
MPEAPISWGDLIDKITILEIKSARLTERTALANVRRELGALERVAGDAIADSTVSAARQALARVNLALWDIEDAIREKERAADFGPAFVELARSVYRHNDERAAIKRRINLILRSDLIEEKSYPAY